MWKLRLKHLFGGYGHLILPVILALGFFGMMTGRATGSPPAAFIGLLAGLFIPGLAAYLHQYCSRDARERAAAAESPEWRELEPEEFMELRSQQVRKSPALRYFLKGQAVMIFLSIILLAKGEPIPVLLMEGGTFLIAMIHVIVTSLSSGKWENVDGSARIAEIPLEETFIVTKHHSDRVDRLTYYVFYLREGKFITDADQLYSGLTVKIVRWAGSVIYLRRSTDK